MKKFALCFALAAAGCAPLTEEASLPDKPFLGPVPIKTSTPADAALECLSRMPEVRNSKKVFAVHIINDRTQKYSSDDTGGYVPTDVAGMMVTALAKAGVPQVNRMNTAVTEFEIGLAREQILGGNGPVVIEGETLPYRPIERGELRGSDYVIDGAITQLDFNSYSGGGEALLGGIGGGVRRFALTAAADLRVTETKSTRIVMADSYSKQAVGSEVFASIFRFVSNEELFDVKIGSKELEGLHFGIRWMLAEAAYDIVSDLTKHDGRCDQLLPANTQALRQPEPVRVAATQ